MPCYVDNARLPFGRMLMCHLIADTPAELHAMAATIGVARRWYQKAASFPHYDICLSKRALAIRAGAVSVTDRKTFVARMQRIRGGRTPEHYRRMRKRWGMTL